MAKKQSESSRPAVQARFQRCYRGGSHIVSVRSASGLLVFRLFVVLLGAFARPVRREFASDVRKGVAGDLHTQALHIAPHRA